MKKYLSFLFTLACAPMVHAAPFAYVCNYGGDNVSIVDLGTNTATGYVDTGSFDITNPVDVRHTPDGTKAYLVADFNNTMFVIDTSTNAITSQIDSNNFPFNAPDIVKFTPDGTKAYVSNEGGNNVTIIDVATDTITGYVSDPESTINLPIGIAFSPDGTLALVCNYNGNTVSVIDVATDTVTGIITDESVDLQQPTFINFINGSKAYASSLNSGQVIIIDVSSQTVTGVVDSGSFSFSLPFFVGATSDGATEILIDAGDTQAFTWSPSTDSVSSASGTFTAAPRQFIITSDNTTAYVTDIGNNSVNTLDIASNTITGAVDDSSFSFNAPFAISISP